MALLRSVDQLLEKARKESTMARYDAMIRIASGGEQQPTTENIINFLLRQANSATSVSQTKTMRQALRYYNFDKSILKDDWARLEKAIDGTRHIIRENRDDPPSRPTLRDSELASIVQLVKESDTAYLFTLMAFLSWRFSSLVELRPEHFTQDKTQETVSITVKAEKSPVDEYAPRQIVGIPFDLRKLNINTANRWQPVIDRMKQDIQLGTGSVLFKIPDYETFVMDVKDKLFSVCAPRLLTLARAGTHVARRTGACSHIQEGLDRETVMYIGGWQNVKEFTKYLHDIQSVVEIESTAKNNSAVPQARPSTLIRSAQG